MTTNTSKNTDFINNSFGRRLNERALELNSPLCVGLDPFANRLPQIFGDGKDLKSWENFFSEIIETIGDKVPAIKPQIGLFEPFGGDAIEVLDRLAKLAKSKGALVILDAKRGDIGSTAQGYADAYLGANAVIDCDCITLNPYMGIETLAPYVTYSRELNKSVAVLVRTSNPGSVDFQELMVDDEPLWIRVAQKLRPLEAELFDGEYSSLMVVVGATWPDEAKRLRKILPHTQFLIPGYGAQGGSAFGALAGFYKKDGALIGGVINSSRGILYPKGSADAANLIEWKQAIKDAVNAAHKDLRDASEIVVNGE